MTGRISLRSFLVVCALTAACCSWGCSKGFDPNKKTPEGYRTTYRCLNCKAETALTLDQINAFYQEKKVLNTPNGDALYPCPKCGKTQLIVVITAPDGKEVQ